MCRVISATCLLGWKRFITSGSMLMPGCTLLSAVAARNFRYLHLIFNRALISNRALVEP
jgi:hypothetical protein